MSGENSWRVASFRGYNIPTTKNHRQFAFRCSTLIRGSIIIRGSTRYANSNRLDQVVFPKKKLKKLNKVHFFRFFLKTTHCLKKDLILQCRNSRFFFRLFCFWCSRQTVHRIWVHKGFKEASWQGLSAKKIFLKIGRRCLLRIFWKTDFWKSQIFGFSKILLKPTLC